MPANRFFPRLTGVVRNLLAALVAAYVAQLVLQNWLGVPVVQLLALWPGTPAPWQLVTYLFVDGQQPMWFLLGLLFLYWSLSRFEHEYGARRTLQLCAVAVLSASTPAWLIGFVVPSPPLGGSGPLWYGSMAATAWLYRREAMSLFGLVTMTGQQLLYLFIGLSVLSFLFDRDHTRLVAELAAIGGAIAFVRYLQRPRKRPAPKRPSRRPSGLRVIEGGGQDGDDRPKWLN